MIKHANGSINTVSKQIGLFIFVLCGKESRKMLLIPCSLAFLLATQVFCMVELKNNGYENLVIAINPALPEDGKIIDKIKDMMTEASAYLFIATQRRAYFKSVKILIPLTWTRDPSYSRVKTETFDKADVIVADPFLKYGDDPYTLQYGGCGEPGKYIHFTLNFITDDSLLLVYGPRGRLFVHEWAHLRWGVFDEYNNDRPFYISGNIKTEATRCSKNIQGNYKYIECKGKSCSLRDCRYDAMTGLFEDGCTFIPDATQNTKASVMYMQALPSVVEFCNSSTHNTEAPNLQNRMCDSQSTWDVIKSSNDFRSTLPMSGTTSPPAPTFSLLQVRERVICLVLHTSGSMNSNDRINRQYQAAELFLLQMIEPGSFVGVVAYESNAHIKSNLRQIIHDNDRKNLISALPTIASGGTNICAGIRKGFEVTKQSGGTYGTEIVLLNADEDDYNTVLCFADIKTSDAIVHIIALGPTAAKELEQIAHMTGGLRFYASDKLDSNGLIDAFSGLSSLGTAPNFPEQTIQLETCGLSLRMNECLDQAVAIDSTVGNDTSFVVTWQGGPPSMKVIAPNGVTYVTAAFLVSSTTRTARLQIPGTAQAGDWKYSLCNTQTAAQVLSMTVTSRAANNNVPPVAIRAQMNKDTNMFPYPMIVYAEVSQGFLPVTGAKVTAIIDPQNGPAVTLELLDNGAGADIVKNDGIYSRYFTAFSGNGRYSLKVRVQGKDKTVKRVIRMQRSNALRLPGYADNGLIFANPLRPSDDHIQPNLESFSRTTNGGSFIVSAVPPGPLSDIFPPSKITDLDAHITDKKIDLSWTAPGADLDGGQAAEYDIRMSKNPLELRDNFEKMTAVNVSALTPHPAGFAETFSFVPENLALANGTIIFFAVRAIDGGAHKANVSNIAQAALFSVEPTPAPSSSGSYNIGAVIIILCSSIVLVCLILSVTLFSLNRNRRPETGL